MISDEKIFILPDVYPWATIQINSGISISESILEDMSIYTGANVGTATFIMNKLTFGDHVQQNMPVKIAIESLSNIIFRGFITEETGTLSDSEDGVKITALDYKWYFSKITRIRGRWFTNDDDVPSFYGSPNSVGSTKLKHELFKGYLDSDSGRSGYLQNLPCVFNENNLPDCATSGTSGNRCVFKLKRMTVTNNIQYVQKYNYKAYYWTYQKILKHIVYYWLEPYAYTYTSIVLSDNSISELNKLDDDDQIPYNLSIEDKNPLEAIDTVVKSIPGRWIWYLTYTGAKVIINVENLNNKLSGKNLSIGKWEKMPENPVNIASISVIRNVEESAKYFILKGGKIKLTTTVELIPVYETLSKGTPFENETDFNKWKEYVLEKKDEHTKIEKYEKAYKYYCIPIEGELLNEALDRVTYKSNIGFDDSDLSSIYGGLGISDLKTAFCENTFVSRGFGAPAHPNFDNPVFFAFDEYLKTNAIKSKESETDVNEDRKIVIYEKGYSFDSESGLVIFEEPQHCRFYYSTGTANSDSNDGLSSTTVSEGKDVESELHLPDKLTMVDKEMGDDYPLISRRIFCTLSIDLDVPYILGDDKSSIFTQLSGSNFSRYIDFDGNDLVVHANAFYPVLPDKKVTLSKTSSCTLASEGSEEFACTLSSTNVSNKLYPIEYIEGYEKYPDENNEVLKKKLNSYIDNVNWYKETLDIDLGILNLSYKLGDLIGSITNSETSNTDSGYYGLKDYISSLSISLEGETKGYNTKLVATNDTEFVASEYNKEREDLLRRQEMKNGSYRGSKFMEINNK
jgi:hypothetical protein